MIDNLTKLTVYLVPKSCEALDKASAISKDTNTDTVNRALQVYAFIVGVLDSGGNIFIQEGKNEDTLYKFVLK